MCGYRKGCHCPHGMGNPKLDQFYEIQVKPGAWERGHNAGLSEGKVTMVYMSERSQCPHCTPRGTCRDGSSSQECPCLCSLGSYGLQ